MFGNPTEYRQLNGGAHRKRANNLRAPALTWHLGFWTPSLIEIDDDGNEPAVDNNSRRTLALAIDRFILAFCRTLTKDDHVEGLEISPCINGTIILFGTTVDMDSLIRTDPKLSERQADIKDSDYRVVSVKWRWYSLNFTLRVELHTEYFSITSFAECSGLDAPLFLKLRDKFELLEELLVDGGSPSLGTALSSYFFEEFWELLLQRMFTRSPLIPFGNDPLFANVFADFRGIVLSTEMIPSLFPESEGNDSSWGNRAEDRIRRLVTDIDSYEYTASYMLGKRALYMSALGPQHPEDHDNRRIPLTFLLCVRDRSDAGASLPINKWQLGRLVDRIHLLGTVRLAALKNFGELRNAGTTLSGLDPLTTLARDSVTAHRTSGKRSDAIQCITDAHDHFNKVTQQFVAATSSATGLTYRVERSRYYVEQFKTNVRALRLAKIEGCQRYDEFVERRLGATFDFIHRLGLRYERAVNSLSMLDQNYLAIRANKTESDVREIQRLRGFCPDWIPASLLPDWIDIPRPAGSSKRVYETSDDCVVIGAFRFWSVSIY
jgi:hypothetical protein